MWVICQLVAFPIVPVFSLAVWQETTSVQKFWTCAAVISIVTSCAAVTIPLASTVISDTVSAAPYVAAFTPEAAKLTAPAVTLSPPVVGKLAIPWTVAVATSMFLLISVQSAALVGLSWLAIIKSPTSKAGFQKFAGTPVPATVTA